ncbi:hypothetical protein [Oceanobacillus saliphilus]|uniref:hypothetical protein n=1 Tax=Oceanobacillus saliphilus TaxID=2925834 RepID=UPI00201E1C67|nr:hypothetical protein [Oceanobacillus saliphilus]
MGLNRFMQFIHIGNVGIVKDYVYIFCSLVGIIIIYYCMKPIIQWAVKLKLGIFLNYLISSILVLLSIVTISFFVERFHTIDGIKFTLQSMAIFGIMLSMSILIGRFIRKTN